MNRQNTGRNLLLVAGTIIAAFSILLTGCDDKVEITQKYTTMEPVYLSPQELTVSFEVMPPVEVTNTGKIYLYNNLIMVGSSGLYQFDYSDPNDIKFLSMISISREEPML